MDRTSTAELLERLAQASLALRDVERRSLWLEMSERCTASELQRPNTRDSKVLAVAAASAEMLAQQQGCPAPAWTSTVGAVPDVVYLDTRATKAAYERMREQSPQPFAQRGFYAPAKYCQLV